MTPASQPNQFDPGLDADPEFASTATDVTVVEPASPIRSNAQALRDTAVDRARGAAQDGLARAGGAVDSIARVVHENADRLGQETSPQVADYAHRAADALDGFAETLRTKNVDELLGDVREFVRKSPAIAIGAAAAIGFALIRLAKASAPNTASGGYKGLDGRGDRAGRNA